MILLLIVLVLLEGSLILITLRIIRKLMGYDTELYKLFAGKNSRSFLHITTRGELFDYFKNTSLDLNYIAFFKKILTRFYTTFMDLWTYLVSFLKGEWRARWDYISASMGYVASYLLITYAYGYLYRWFNRLASSKNFVVYWVVRYIGPKFKIKFPKDKSFVVQAKPRSNRRVVSLLYGGILPPEVLTQDFIRMKRAMAKEDAANWMRSGTFTNVIYVIYAFIRDCKNSAIYYTLLFFKTAPRYVWGLFRSAVHWVNALLVNTIFRITAFRFGKPNYHWSRKYTWFDYPRILCNGDGLLTAIMKHWYKSTADTTRDLKWLICYLFTLLKDKVVSYIPDNVKYLSFIILKKIEFLVRFYILNSRLFIYARCTTPYFMGFVRPYINAHNMFVKQVTGAVMYLVRILKWFLLSPIVVVAKVPLLIGLQTFFFYLASFLLLAGVLDILLALTSTAYVSMYSDLNRNKLSDGAKAYYRYLRLEGEDAKEYLDIYTKISKGLELDNRDKRIMNKLEQSVSSFGPFSILGNYSIKSGIVANILPIFDGLVAKVMAKFSTTEIYSILSAAVRKLPTVLQLDLKATLRNRRLWSFVGFGRISSEIIGTVFVLTTAALVVMSVFYIPETLLRFLGIVEVLPHPQDLVEFKHEWQKYATNDVRLNTPGFKNLDKSIFADLPSFGPDPMSLAKEYYNSEELDLAPSYEERVAVYKDIWDTIRGRKRR